MRISTLATRDRSASSPRWVQPEIPRLSSAISYSFRASSEMLFTPYFALAARARPEMNS
jgi:hypothetical protein